MKGASPLYIYRNITMTLLTPISSAYFQGLVSLIVPFRANVLFVW